MVKNKFANKSIKTNFAFNLLNTVSSLLFPLITFPYAARVVLAEGIGQVQFYTSIINYISLGVGLGIPMYAIREIARVRDDIKNLTKTTVEIILLSVLLSLVGYIAVAVLCFTVADVSANIPLFLILSSTILLTAIGCPWFYSGIEDFKYITIRGLLVKFLCIIILFTLVKSKEDLLYYGVYCILGSIGNYILNFVHLHHFINLKLISLKDLDIKKHIQPAFSVFILNLVTSIYLNLDSIMVGFIGSNEQVGYYTAATKLSHMMVTLVTSLGAVLLPRLSNLIKENHTDEFYRLAKKSYRMISLISYPIALGMIVMAPILISIFSGDSYYPAILTLQLISPIVVFIAISNLVGIQVLYPLGKVKLVTISTAVGAMVNFTLNLILIPLYKQNGAAIATSVAEFSVLLTQFVVAKKYIPFGLINKRIISYFISSIIMFLGCQLMMLLNMSESFKLFLIPLSGICIYGTLLLLQRDEFVFEIIAIVKRKFI